VQAKKKPLLSNSVNGKVLALLSLMFGGVICHGQQNLEHVYRMTGTAVTAAFEEQRISLQSSSAVVMDGRTEAIFGVVVSPEGHVLTKASEFESLQKPEVVIDRKRYGELKVLGRDARWDVVMLKVDAEGLKPVEYAEGEPEMGSWIVVNGATTRFERRALVGIISAKAREIPVEGGAGLGVVLNNMAKVPTVEDVQPGSGAQEAGLQKGDVIVRIGETKITSTKEVLEAIKDRKAGEMVKVVVRRGKKEQEFEVRLASKAEMFRSPETLDRNDQMSGDFSKRRSGFPRVIQHDVLGNSKSMGGPIIDLNGKCVGMNIARANRAETFGIPAKELREIAERLMAEKKE
jgi:serine protease Do